LRISSAKLTTYNSLREEDRDVVKKAARKVSTHTFVGSMLGVGLGGFLAYRLRANRKAFYQAFRATEKPTHVKFADGREEAIPDVTPLLQPTPLGDVFTYTFFTSPPRRCMGNLMLLSRT